MYMKWCRTFINVQQQIFSDSAEATRYTYEHILAIQKDILSLFFIGL